MLKLFNTLMIFSIVFSYGECFNRGNSFDNNLRLCNKLCIRERIPNPIRRNEIRNCVVLWNHNDMTITQCVADCLRRHRENLEDAVECKCRNRQCIPPEPPTTSDSSEPSEPTLPSSSSTSSTTSPSTSSTSSPSTSSTSSPSTSSTSSSSISSTSSTLPPTTEASTNAPTTP